MSETLIEKLELSRTSGDLTTFEFNDPSELIGFEHAVAVELTPSDFRPSVPVELPYKKKIADKIRPSKFIGRITDISVDLIFDPEQLLNLDCPDYTIARKFTGFNISADYLISASAGSESRSERLTQTGVMFTKSGIVQAEGGEGKGTKSYMTTDPVRYGIGLFLPQATFTNNQAIRGLLRVQNSAKSLR